MKKYYIFKACFLYFAIMQIFTFGTVKAMSDGVGFVDVPISHPNFSAIMELQNLGIIQGYPDKTFKPDQSVSRAEALKIILLGSGVNISDVKGTGGFVDVKADEWCAKYIVNAVQLGVAQGYVDHTFRPAQTVNLAENLKMLFLAKKININSIIVTKNPYIDAFADQWYSKFFQYAQQKNLIKADSQNKVYPGQGMTRGKLAEILYKIIYIEKNGLDAYPLVVNSAPQPTQTPVLEPAPSLTPQTPGSVHFTVDPTSSRQNISPYIYGNNEVANLSGEIREPHLKLIRLGGNRWTAYNWENNASNAGTDWQNFSDNYLSSSTVPGDAVKTRVDQVFTMGADALVTVPIVDYVAADKDGPVNTVASDNNPRWDKNLPDSSGTIPIKPDLNDRNVYQDQFVNWVQKTYQTQLHNGRKIFYSLDNEPALWPGTHPMVHPQKTTYAEMAKRTVDYSTMIKKMAPESLVFGAVAYGYYEYVALQGAPDQNGRNYLDFFLETVKQAEVNAGKRLVDVLDLHWYPEAIGGGVRIGTSQNSTPSTAEIEARVQAPRSLWDPAYVENSWITNDVLNKGPIRLIPWLKDKIAQHYPGTKLSFSEYNYGGESHISGGLAEADVLGIFGREGVFSAAYWPLKFNNPNSFIYGAFELYLNYDGKGSGVGDISVSTQNSDVAETSAYTMVKSNDPNIIHMIVINKTAKAIPATISLKNSSNFAAADVYQLTAAASKPQKSNSFSFQNNTFNYQMPALSVSLLVVHP